MLVTHIYLLMCYIYKYSIDYGRYRFYFPSGYNIFMQNKKKSADGLTLNILNHLRSCDLGFGFESKCV